MKTEDRKAAIAAYKERKIARGIYAIRCAPSGEIWVGSAPDLSTIQNRIWFSLRHGGHSHRALQDAWNVFGSAAFTFEVLEHLKEEPQYGFSRELRDLLESWAGKLNATRL